MNPMQKRVPMHGSGAWSHLNWAQHMTYDAHKTTEFSHLTPEYSVSESFFAQIRFEGLI